MSDFESKLNEARLRTAAWQAEQESKQRAEIEQAERELQSRRDKTESLILTARKVAVMAVDASIEPDARLYKEIEVSPPRRGIFGMSPAKKRLEGLYSAWVLRRPVYSIEIGWAAPPSTIITGVYLLEEGDLVYGIRDTDRFATNLTERTKTEVGPALDGTLSEAEGLLISFIIHKIEKRS